jgi:flagellar biosynthesis anti-sigma factor FlgM
VKIDSQIPAPENSGTNPVRDSHLERNKKPAASPAPPPSDSVHLSSDQTTVRQLVTQLNQVSEVRTDRVHALRTEVQSGKYQRSDEQIAGALVGELLNAPPGH